MQIISESPAQTKGLGKKIASFLKEGDVIALFGELGSGKTTLAQGIISALGIGESYIISPTFVLIREYKGEFKVFHLDLYRLNYIEELFELGYEDYFYSPKGVSLIEWAQKAKSLLPKNYLKIELLNRTETSRLIKISAVGSRFKKQLAALM